MPGSSWKKWGLHFHSQSSYDYKDKNTTDQEIINALVNKNISVVVITDHHVTDIKRIKNLQSLGKGKITVLPGIEFRAELGGSESIHFIGIFSEVADIDNIWIKLQSTCEITAADVIKKGGDQHIHCDLKDTCKLIHDLGGIVSVHAGAKTNTIENITNCLPYKMALKTDLVINHIDILELGKEEDQIDYNEKVFPTIKYRLPMVICSDNHEAKRYITKQNLWIKSEATFEGLKQIRFEPIYRVHIGENFPISPPIRINKVTLNFPQNSTFENEPFCLSGKREIIFSPNFTCLVGGRGTGKSTILNLIHEKLKPNENEFFKNRKIKDKNGNIVSINDSVSIDQDTDEKQIEYLSQNEIEEFALNSQKLTAAIYSRLLKKDAEGKLESKEIKLVEQIKLLRELITYNRKVRSLQNDLNQKQKDLETFKTIVDSFSSTTYSDISSIIKKLSKEFNDVNYAKDRHSELMKDLHVLIDKYSIPHQSSSIYILEIFRIIEGIKKLIEIDKIEEFQKVEIDQQKLSTTINQQRKILTEYLSNKGLTEENLNDISNANVGISNLEQEIINKKVEIESIEKKIKSFDWAELRNSSSSYKTEIEKQITNINGILEKPSNASVKPISLHFEFNDEAACSKIFEEFKLVFEGRINQSNHKGDANLREILFCINPKGIPDQKDLLESIKNHSSNSAAKGFLYDLLSENSNFEVYKLLCEKTLLNYAEFKKIKVQYDKRPIEISSFGQRCTAVLVILLLLGNNPNRN